MRKITLLFLLLLPSFFAKAQTPTIDSLKQLLKTETRDTARVTLLNQLSRSYIYNKPDTAITLGQQALLLSRKIDFKSGEAYSLNRIATVFSTTGNYPKALELLLQALKMAEVAKDEKVLGGILTNMGNNYSFQGNYRQGNNYALKGLAILQHLGDKNSICISLMNLGANYEKFGMLDSAMYYTNQAYSLVLKLQDTYLIGGVLNNLGNIYAKMGKTTEAMANYKLCLPYFMQEDMEDGLCEAYLGMAGLFGKAGKADSALHYAKLSLNYGRSGGFTVRIMDASKFLTDYYSSIHNIDSAFAYQSATIAAKDSLFSEEKQREIQSLSFDESMRQQQILDAKEQAQTQIKFNILFGGIGTLLIVAFLLYRNSWQRKKANVLLQSQKQKVEIALSELKSTQQQLVQSEKMASLGELTAGIAHEIQNPLNFVNNFSEVNNELIEELKTCLSGRQVKNEKLKIEDDEVNELLSDIRQNLEKINFHGKRADAIVKGMLQHSRTSTGQKELTDINALCDEYLRLAYHGLRAKDKSFNANFETHFDDAVGKINVIPQDTGRVLLNLINNAFYAVNEKAKQNIDRYEPTITVSTKKTTDKVSISVTDNGNGITKNIVDKIFQPFFTTKPTGSGTGLGLSLAYDIIKAHGGEIKVETKEGEGTKFIIHLPNHSMQ